MPELAAFQQDFLRRIDDPATAVASLAVYRNTSRLGAISAIADNFPTVRRIVGAQAMAILAGEFVEAHPPRSPVLADYGADFPCWLADHPLAEDLDYLPAVAQIDRLRVESHLAEDAPVFELEDLVRLTAEQWSRCRVTLHPATRVGWFAIPAPSIWTAHLEDEIGEIAPEWRPEGILIARRNGAVGGCVIDGCGHRILHGLRLGETVGHAALAASRLHPAGNISRAFRKIVSSGALTSLKMKG
jgi:hypothetical protein